MFLHFTNEKIQVFSPVFIKNMISNYAPYGCRNRLTILYFIVFEELCNLGLSNVFLNRIIYHLKIVLIQITFITNLCMLNLFWNDIENALNLA